MPRGVHNASRNLLEKKSAHTMKTGAVLLWLSAGLFAFTLRSINRDGGDVATHAPMIALCFVLAMAGASSSAGKLTVLGDERAQLW